MGQHEPERDRCNDGAAAETGEQVSEVGGDESAP